MRLTIDNINPHVKAAKYAVRGELAVKSEEYRARLSKGDANLPFSKVISANIGNPQQLDQKPITFFRQVLSLLENPLLLEHEDVLLNRLGYKTDVIARAKWLLSKVGSVGAYSASTGCPALKESVAAFIERKTKHTVEPRPCQGPGHMTGTPFTSSSEPVSWSRCARFVHSTCRIAPSQGIDQADCPPLAVCLDFR